MSIYVDSPWDETLNQGPLELLLQRQYSLWDLNSEIFNSFNFLYDTVTKGAKMDIRQSPILREHNLEGFNEFPSERISHVLVYIAQSSIITDYRGLSFFLQVVVVTPLLEELSPQWCCTCACIHPGVKINVQTFKRHSDG